MKSALPLLTLIFFATSCTTAYKSGQTPDDVYYSPEKKINSNEYVQTTREDDGRQYRTNRRNQVEDDYAYSDDDRYLRMKVRNPRMWSDLDYYYNDPYAGGYYSRPNIYSGIGLYGGNFWSPYSYWNAYNNWNYYYNPYYMPHGNIVVVNPNTSPVYNRPRTMNLNTFNRGSDSYSSPNKRSNNSYQTFDSRPSRNSNAGSLGNDVRRSFGTNSNSSSNNTYSTPSRSSSGSSGSGSSSSGSSAPRSAPVRKF